MDTKVQPKENQGAVGAGFEGRTGSNSYSALPRSSNASLGIDADVAAGGRGAAVSNTNTGGAQNVGNKEMNSSRKNLGYDEPWAEGTVGATTAFRQYGSSAGAIKADERGQFGETALGGSRKEGSTDATLGSGSRAKGTAGNETGTPGQSGSMAMAKKGLSGGTGPNFNEQTSGQLNYSRGKALKGLNTKPNVRNN